MKLGKEHTESEWNEGKEVRRGRDSERGRARRTTYIGILIKINVSGARFVNSQLGIQFSGPFLGVLCIFWVFPPALNVYSNSK
jgi:hypothetical protein